MRITTGMLKIAHKRSGSIQKGSSLLNYVGKTGAGTSRMNAMAAANARNMSVFGNMRLDKSNYEKLEKSADELTDAVSDLASKVDSGAEDVSGEAALAVDKFNENLKNLKVTPGVLNQFYYQSMKEISVANRSELEEIGISVAEDGTLTLNKQKLASADGKKVAKLLGSGGDFSLRVRQVSSRVADNAGVNAQTVSSRYTAKGRVADSYINRYNFRG